MIGAILTLASEVVEIRVKENEVYFKSANNLTWATIDGLKLNYNGVIKEFPDLEGEPGWKQQAIERFKEKISKLKTEDEKIDYVIEDLKKHGYKPKYKQKQGFRPIPIK